MDYSLNIFVLVMYRYIYFFYLCLQWESVVTEVCWLLILLFIITTLSLNGLRQQNSPKWLLFGSALDQNRKMPQVSSIHVCGHVQAIFTIRRK